MKTIVQAPNTLFPSMLLAMKREQKAAACRSPTTSNQPNLLQMIVCKRAFIPQWPARPFVARKVEATFEQRLLVLMRDRKVEGARMGGEASSHANAAQTRLSLK